MRIVGRRTLRPAPRMALVLPACLAMACTGTVAEFDAIDSDGSAVDQPPIFANGSENPPLFPQSSAAAGEDLALHVGPAAASDEAPPDDGGGEPVDKGFIGMTAQSNAEIFSWSTTQGAITPDVLMRPTSTHICVLTRIGGNLGGLSGLAVHHNNTNSSSRCQASNAFTGVTINSAVDDTGPTWKLGGCQLEPNSLSAEATCVPGSNFSTDPGGVVAGSNVFMTEMAGLNRCPETQTADMWPGMAVAFLSGVVGQFEGGGEVLKIISASSSAAPARVSAETHYCDRPLVDGSGYSLFVGIPDGRHTTKRSYATSVSTASGAKTKKLATTREALCYLTKVSGDLDGAPERVRIYPEIDSWGTEWWMINVNADRGSVYATAECVRYSQGTAPPP